MPSSNRIGILGAGRAGTAFARAAARVGIDTQIASTRTPSQMRYHLMQYAPQAQAVPAEEIGQGVELVILAVPQEDIDGVAPEWLADRILIDATNRWEDEALPDWFEAGLSSGLSSSEVIAARFPSATVVKTLNHLSHWAVDAPQSDGDRAIFVASDDATARSHVEQLMTRLGFQPVSADTLSAGRRVEPGSRYFNVPATAEQLAELL